MGVGVVLPVSHVYHQRISLKTFFKNLSSVIQTLHQHIQAVLIAKKIRKINLETLSQWSRLSVRHS